jgi:glutathione synthase/RimK-type ligase-like ATP-grasp enzyme
MNDIASVLLWGMPHDIPLAAVCTELSRLGTPMLLVDQTRVLETELGVEADGGGWLQVGGQRCDLGRVRSAYVRPDSTDKIDGIARAGPGSGAWCHAVEVDYALAQWLELTPAPVLNRLSAMASNGSKPFQTMLIRQAGFEVPDTLLTNDIAALRAFHERHGRIVYKSTSGVRSIVSRLSATDDARLANLATCPTQFQQYIPGADHRVHVIGEEVFGHRIESDADDYRYAGEAGARLEPWDVPQALADRLRILAESLGLVMAGIDLRQDLEGRWVCFEVNPSPGFTFFETDDEQLMAKAVARLLSG